MASRYRMGGIGAEEGQHELTRPYVTYVSTAKVPPEDDQAPRPQSFYAVSASQSSVGAEDHDDIDMVDTLDALLDRAGREG